MLQVLTYRRDELSSETCTRKPPLLDLLVVGVVFFTIGWKNGSVVGAEGGV